MHETLQNACDAHLKAIHDPRLAQGVELGGRRVRVGWAQKNTSLYVTGLDAGATITTEMLVREFARFGPLDKELTAIKPGGKCEGRCSSQTPPHPAVSFLGA